LIDYQPVDRHRALGEPDYPDVKPLPGRHLQAHAVEQPAEIRDGGTPVPPVPRPQPADQGQQAARRVPAQLIDDAGPAGARPAAWIPVPR